MICPICGNEMDGRFETCSSCGARIDWGLPETERGAEPVAAPEPEPPVTEPQPQEAYTVRPPLSRAPAERMMRTVSLLIAFSAAAVVVSFVGVLLKNYDLCYYASTVDTFLLMGGVVVSIFSIIMGSRSSNRALKKRGIIGLVVLGSLYFLCALLETVCLFVAPPPDLAEDINQLLSLFDPYLN